MKNIQIIKNGLWYNHPIFRQLLGMCPTLAVTTSFINALSMGLSVIFVLVSSSFIVSLIKRIVPQQVRIAVFTIIISTFVTIVDLFLKANFPLISKALGPYVPLIIVNCIILARLEVFASKNTLCKSLLDAFSTGLGFLWGLLVLGSIREILGKGTLIGIPIIKMKDNLLIMLMPAGAFFSLGFLVGLMNKIEKKKC